MPLFFCSFFSLLLFVLQLIILSAVLKRRLTLADKAKGTFISSISHELRTPLHGILVGSELMSETEMTMTQGSYLETIQACGQSLIETVNHVLDFTKLSGTSSAKSTVDKSMEKTEYVLVKLFLCGVVRLTPLSYISVS